MAEGPWFFCLKDNASRCLPPAHTVVFPAGLTGRQ